MSNKEELKFIVGFIAVIILVISLVTVFAMNLTFYGAKLGCQRTYEATGLETKIVGDILVHSCFINVDGKWIDADNYGMGFTQK